MYFRRQLRVMGIFLPRLSEESGYTANKNDNIGTIQYYRVLRMHKSQRSLEILMGKQTQVFWGSVYSSLWNNVSFLIDSFFFFFKIGMLLVVIFPSCKLFLIFLASTVQELFIISMWWHPKEKKPNLLEFL